MITAYRCDDGKLMAQTGVGTTGFRIDWIDLMNPDRDEEAQVERVLARAKKPAPRTRAKNFSASLRRPFHCLNAHLKSSGSRAATGALAALAN